jgi:hypothetical protein
MLSLHTIKMHSSFKNLIVAIETTYIYLSRWILLRFGNNGAFLKLVITDRIVLKCTVLW